MTIDHILKKQNVWEHKAYVSSLKSGDNNLEYVKISNSYTSQQFSTFFRTTWMTLAEFYEVMYADNENDKQNIIPLTYFL